MKGKRHSAEEKICIIREADTGKSMVGICRERSIWDLTFHRWYWEFGRMDLLECRELFAGVSAIKCLSSARSTLALVR
jgi:hypothetical protein